MATKNLWEHDSYPIREKLEGCDEEYSSVTEFKHHLTANFLSSEEYSDGWVFWTPDRREYSSGHESDNILESCNAFEKRIPEKFTHVLRETILPPNSLVQFWAPEEVGGRCYLTTLHQPFAVGECLTKGVSWLRKKCMQHYYIADNAADKDQLGPPGRVFLNGNPESSPDILLYSNKEFPLRDLVAGCGLKSYLALPIFDMHHNECIGVLEFIGQNVYCLRACYFAPEIDDALEEVGMRLAHKKARDYEQRPLCEIKEMLDLAIKSIPQLHLAQVWVPCQQCANYSSSINCMVRASFRTSTSASDLFVCACGFYNIQSGQGIVGFALSSTNKWCFCKNLSAFSLSEYPMKHYAQRESFSSCFAICLRSKHMNGNDVYVFEFFLQPQSRDVKSILHLLLKIMEKKLKSFEIATEQYLGVEYQQSEEHTLPISTENYEGEISVSESQEFFPMMDLSCLKTARWDKDWIYWSMKGKELTENRGNGSSMPQLNLGTEEIKLLFSEIVFIPTLNRPGLIQLWVPKIIGNKLFLSTSEQPSALRQLKGLCMYRKQCIQYHYYIGDGAKEKELGPPGRVFRNGRPESSPDLRLYSKREFPLWDHVVNSGARAYLALPLFDLLDKKQCLGVLEFVGFPFYWDQIIGKLEKYNLRSTHISQPPSLLIDEGKKQALSEIEEMLTLVIKSPLLQTASVWISCSKCSHDNIEISCMERARFSSTSFYEYHDEWRINEFIGACKFHQMQTRKGVIGKVMESESKLYFCENLCSLSICEQPLVHYSQVARLEICFAICLRSSYTGNSLYVIEFFLSPHSKKYEYSRLCFLLSIMKQMLKSFKVASGQQLGEELISEVRKLCHGMEPHLSKNVVRFEPDGVDSSTHIVDVNQNITGFSTVNQLTGEKFGGQCNLPIGFENIQYSHETEHHHSENQIHFSSIDDSSNIDQEQERNVDDPMNVEDEGKNTTVVNFEEANERDRSSTSFHVSYEQLKSQFGKSRKDAAKNLGVSISTFKRICRHYGIKRWPKMNNIKNPSLFRKKVANKCVKSADHQASKRSGCDLTASDFPVEPNHSIPPIQNTMERANTCQAADVVIKAKFKDDTLKFEFRVSCGVEKLKEEVGKRLDLKIGEFKLKYMDDDDDLILLKCDEDLHFYVKNMKSIGMTTVQVLVHLISE